MTQLWLKETVLTLFEVNECILFLLSAEGSAGSNDIAQPLSVACKKPANMQGTICNGKSHALLKLIETS